jgi:hypothetical protein
MWQGGLTNEQLLEKWKEKLPNREPVGEELSAFAIGIEVGISLPKENKEEQKGDTPCPVCNANGVFKYSPNKDCICQGRAWMWKLG